MLASALALGPTVATVAAPRLPGREPAPEEEADARAAGLRLIDDALGSAGYGSSPAKRTAWLDWSPQRGLNELAGSVRASLVVVGSSHRGSVGRVLAGAVGADLLGDAPCPVAFAPIGFGQADRPPLTRVGVGYDGTVAGARVLDYAAGLAKALKARLRIITLLHTLQPVPPAHEGDVAEIRRALNEAVRTRSGEGPVEARLVEESGAKADRRHGCRAHGRRLPARRPAGPLRRRLGLGGDRADRRLPGSGRSLRP